MLEFQSTAVLSPLQRFLNDHVLRFGCMFFFTWPMKVANFLHHAAPVGKIPSETYHICRWWLSGVPGAILHSQFVTHYANIQTWSVAATLQSLSYPLSLDSDYPLKNHETIAYGLTNINKSQNLPGSPKWPTSSCVHSLSKNLEKGSYAMPTRVPWFKQCGS